MPNTTENQYIWEEPGEEMIHRKPLPKFRAVFFVDFSK